MSRKAVQSSIFKIFQTFLKRYASQLSCKSNMAELVEISPEHMAPSEKSSMAASEDQNLALKSAPNITKPWCLASIVDKICIAVFPALYIGFNIFYWLYYLNIE